VGEVYVRVRRPDGTYKNIEVGSDKLRCPGLTRYFDCRKCGKRVVVGIGEDARNGYCFQCVPKGMKMNGSNRAEKEFI